MMVMMVILMTVMMVIRRQEQALQEAFRRADNSSEGKLTVEDYLKVLQDNRLTATKEEINMMMDIADKNKDGLITRAEVLGEKSRGQVKGDQALRAERAFGLMDRNNDGFITKQEMLSTTSKLTAKQVTAVFDRNDKDGDGKLSKGEFKEMMMRDKGAGKEKNKDNKEKEKEKEKKT